jgi:hypothetical protein
VAAVKFLLGAVLLPLALASPATAAVIRVADDGTFVSFGKFKPGADMKMTRAVRTFGIPDEREPVGDGSQACRHRWLDVGLDVLGSNFGGVPAGSTTCTGRHAYVQVLTVRGKAARDDWRTDRGLRIGATRARMLALYPRAHSIGRRQWSLLERNTGIGTGPTPILQARVTKDRVNSISVWAGGAGD